MGSMKNKAGSSAAPDSQQNIALKDTYKLIRGIVRYWAKTHSHHLAARPSRCWLRNKHLLTYQIFCSLKTFCFQAQVLPSEHFQGKQNRRHALFLRMNSSSKTMSHCTGVNSGYVPQCKRIQCFSRVSRCLAEYRLYPAVGLLRAFCNALNPAQRATEAQRSSLDLKS